MVPLVSWRSIFALPEWTNDALLCSTVERLLGRRQHAQTWDCCSSCDDALGWSGLRTGRRAGRGCRGPPAPTGKAGYFANSDLQNIWKDLEARQILNKRVLEGGSHSINIRIVRPTDEPLVHANSLDIWLVSAGSATAVTGGQLLDMKKRPNSDDAAGTSIKGGVEQPLKAGDVLYVPPGVPHGFKDIQGFRAFLIRFDSK